MHMKYRAATALGTSLLGLVPAAALAQSAAPFNWSGFYVGGHMGVVQSGGPTSVTGSSMPSDTGYSISGSSLYLNGSSVDDLPTPFDLQGTNGLVGVDAGYNVAQGNFVFGVEGDYDLLAGGGHTGGSAMSSSGETIVGFDSSLSSLATLRGRVGISADRLLLFATAGIAAGQTSLSSDLSYYDGGKSSFSEASASGTGNSTTAIGYVAGAGAELAVSDNVTVRAEALYYNLGKQNVTALGSGYDSIDGGVGFTPYTASYTPQGVIIDTGVNFKF